MNTLAKVVRSDSAAGVLPFHPNELGNNAAPSSADSQIYRFPVLEPANIHAPAAKVINIGPGTRDHIFPQIEELPAESFLHEPENGALENAVREKMLSEIRAAAEAEVEVKIGHLRDNLTATIDRISGLEKEIASRQETEVVELALEIAKKVVSREINIEPEVVLSVTRNALAKLNSRTLASIHLHPDDLAYVQEHRNKLNFHGSLELIEDSLVTPGGCLIHTDTGDVDGRIESQFDEITNGLLGTSAG